MELLRSPLLWFATMVLAAWLLYWWAARVAPPFRPTPRKVGAYVGGESVAAQAYTPGYQFFHIALFFTLVHVAALVVATVPRDAFPWAALLYLGIVGLAVAVLRWSS